MSSINKIEVTECFFKGFYNDIHKTELFKRFANVIFISHEVHLTLLLCQHTNRVFIELRNQNLKNCSKEEELLLLEQIKGMLL